MSTTTSTTPATKPQPVLIAQGILAGLAFIFGGITTMGATSNNDTLALIGGLGTLLTGGANIAVGFVVRGQVVPLSDVAAFRNDQREIVTGPASPADVPEGVPAAPVQAADEPV